MSLDKKAILKEIEVLIRSIKVHYDNIEHEYRIPTIELELITAKIRKLHEKSIVYNHLHYIEEEQLQNSKRIKFDQMVMRQAAENNMPNEIVVESQQNETFATQLKFEEKIASIEKSDEEETLAAAAEEHPESIEQKQDIEIEKNTIETPTLSTSFNQVKLAGKIGINDRFRFIKNLFGGNGVAMEEAIKEIEQCGSASSLAACINKLRSTNQWDDEDENVIDFMAMLK
jgi:hypothetical protein